MSSSMFRMKERDSIVGWLQRVNKEFRGLVGWRDIIGMTEFLLAANEENLKEAHGLAEEWPVDISPLLKSYGITDGLITRANGGFKELRLEVLSARVSQEYSSRRPNSASA